MKTAVIIDGQMRTFARCLPNQKWMVFRHLEEPAFFVSCAKDAQAKDAELLRAAFPNARVEIEHVEQPAIAEPPASLMAHAPYDVTPTRTPGVSAAQGILRQLWSQSRAWRFACEHNAEEAATFVRIRPDLHFHEFFHPLIPALGIAPEPARTFDAFCCYWGNYGGVNDRFAILGREAARAWFTTYDKLPAMFEAGAPLHPETLRAFALEIVHATIHRNMRAEFSFRRENGSLEFPVILPGELAFNAL